MGGNRHGSAADQRVTINVKEKRDGNYVYSFSAEKQKEPNTPQTLHAAVRGNNAPNVQLSNTKITQNDSGVKNNSMQESGEYSDSERKSIDIDVFKEDKYYARQIDKWHSLKDGAYITVGDIRKSSPLNLVGIPEGKLYFDVSKIQSEMNKHGDHLDEGIFKQIPKLLADPIAIVEYEPGESTNTVKCMWKMAHLLWLV